MTDAPITPTPTAALAPTAVVTSVVPPATGVDPAVQPSGSAAPVVTPPGSDPWAGLNPENLAFVKGKNFTDPNAQIASHRELQTAYSQKAALVDVPADANGYDFAAPADLPEGVGYSPEFATAYKQAMLEGKVPKSAAKHTHDWFVNYAKDAAAKQVEATNRSITESKVTLVREWGPEEGPQFSRNVELANRAVEQLGLSDHLVKSGALLKSADGKMTVVDAATVKAFSKIGMAMFAEDGLYGTAASNSNPFAKDTENASAQAKVFKENPHKTLQLIKQSGQPEKFAYLASVLAKQGVA
jgi:hypothetical protein